jgi:hypothetical protein
VKVLVGISSVHGTLDLTVYVHVLYNGAAAVAATACKLQYFEPLHLPRALLGGRNVTHRGKGSLEAGS